MLAALLVAADKLSGLKTSVFTRRYEEDAPINARVTHPLGHLANKAANDRVFTSLKPDYLILGVIDVVPRQDLKT